MTETLNQDDIETKEGCIFCDIASEVTVANVVFDGGDTLFFNDISPKARVHVVGILKTHMSSLGEINASNSAMVGKLLSDAVVVAEKMGLKDGGYRIITNVGQDAGQEVKHLHFHILGGEVLGSLRC
jgi:histidine triad (HIT) family protein